MQKFIKNFSVVAMLSASSLIMVIHTPLMAADGSSEKPADPKEVPITPPGYDQRPAVFNPYIVQLKDWFEKNGGTFLQDAYKSGLPVNAFTFKQNNPITAYQVWYAQNYGSRVSTEQLERVKQEAIQEARTHANSEHAVEVSQLKNQLAITTGLLANGGNFSDPNIDKVVQRIKSAKNVKQLITKFDEHTRNVAVGAIVDGANLAHEFKNLKQQDYLALKLLFAVFENMYSKAYAAAAQSMGNLISDILASQEPQDYHEMQIDDLSTSITGLKGHVQYHRETGKFLTDCDALPLFKFLNITFLDDSQIRQLREKSAKGFDEIVSFIPRNTTGFYGSPALTSFIEKVQASLWLQAEIPITEDEITAIFKELGLLLEIDTNGVVQTHSAYFDELLGISRDVAEFKGLIKNRKEEAFEDEDNIARFKKADLAIKNNDLNGIIPPLREILPTLGSDPITNMIEVKLRGIDRRIEILKKNTIIDPVTLVYQAAGTAASDILAGEDKLKPLRTILFLVKRFAPKEYKSIADKLVLISGPLDPAVEAACSKYYTDAISSTVTIDQIRSAMNKMDGILFDEKSYETLRKAEAKIATKNYLDTLIQTGKPPVIDLDQLRCSALGVDTSMPERVRNGLLIKTCELMDPEINAQPKKTLRQLTNRCFGHPVIHTAAYYFEILHAELGNNDGKKAFLDSYINLPVMGNSSSTTQMTLQEKAKRASEFFDTALTAAAESDALVTLVRTLPNLKKDHKVKIMGQPEIVSKNQQQIIGFVEKVQKFLSLYERGKAFETLSVYAKAALKKDEQLFLVRIFDKLAQLSKISKDFLEVDYITSNSTNKSSALDEENASFAVLAGLKRLEFDNIFRSEHYFEDLYNASKVLNFLELMIPSDQDFAKLETVIISVTDSPDQVKIKAEIDALVQFSKELKTAAIEFFGQIKSLMQFVKEFQALKPQYNEPTGKAKPLDFYAEIDRIPAFELSMPGGLFSAPPTWMYCADTTYKGVDVTFKVTDKEMEKTVFGKPFNKTSATEKIQREVAVGKVKAFYQPILDAQKQYFSRVNFAQMTEQDVIPFVRQLLVFIDLWIRIDTMERIIVNKDGTESEVVKLFIKNYLDVYTAYTTKILGLCHKNPSGVTEANGLDLLKMLRNINPAIRDQIGKKILDIFFAADMKRELDVYAQLKPTIDGALSANNFVNGSSHEIDAKAVRAFVTIPND